MIAFPVRAFRVIGVLAVGLSCGTAAGQSPNRLPSPDGLETLRAEDRERRALLAEARGQHREAGRLTEEAAGFRHNKQMHVQAAWHYFDAGDYAEMLRAARVCFAEQPRFDNAATAVRVAEQLSTGQLDWSSVQATVRGIPAPPQKRLVPIASPEGQVALAHLAWRQGFQNARARRILERVVADRPDLPEAHLLLSDLYRTFLFTREAARERAAAARLDPDAPRNAIYQVWRLRALGKKDEATRRLGELTSTASGDLLAQIIELYHVEENPEEVESILREALLVDARQPTPKLVGGFSTVLEHFHRAGRYGALIKLLDELLAARPQDTGLVRLLTAAHLLNRTPVRAAEMVRQHPALKSATSGLAFYAALAAGDRKLAVENAPSSPGPYIGLLLHWIDPGGYPLPDLTHPGMTVNFQVANIHLQRVGQSDYLYPFELAAVYAAVEQIASAQPDAWPALFHRSVLLKDQGRVDEAVALMRKVAEKQSEWWPAWLFLYTHAVTMGRAGEAEKQYEKLRQIAPSQVRVQAPLRYLAPIPPEYGSGFPLEIRELRDAQAQMLAGNLEPAITRLRKLSETSTHPEVRLTLGAALFAQERLDEAQKEWELAGFRTPLRGLFAIPAHFPLVWKPPFLPGPAPKPTPGMTGLRAYRLREVALHAAEYVARSSQRPETAVRLMEFLLRLAVKEDPDYLPALYPLAHLLRQGEYIAQMATPLYRAPESRVKESDALLARVLKHEPGDLRTLWALGRYAEAARRNPESVEAWKRVLADPEMPADLLAEAARQMRRLQPADIQTQRKEILRVGIPNPEDGLRSARALALETGAPEIAVLAGVFAFKLGNWSTAANEFQRTVDGPLGWRQRHGFTAPLLLSISRLAAGEPDKAREAALTAARADAADPLPRLLLAYFAEGAGKPAERDFHLAAASVTGSPAARKGALALVAGEDNLGVDLEPALATILLRYPDCFPASYLLAHARLRRTNEWPARFAGLPEYRATLKSLSARFPNWSGPAASLVLASMIEPDASAEATRRLEGERQRLAATVAPKRGGSAVVPIEPKQTDFYRSDMIPRLQSFDDGKILLSLTDTVRVFDARTGTLLNEYRNPSSYGEAVVAASTLVVSLDSGVAALEPLTGELRWSHEWNPGSAKQIVPIGNHAAAVTREGAVLYLSEAGAKLWEAPAPPAPRDRRFDPVSDGERLYLVEEGQKIRVLELKSGRELSRFHAPAPTGEPVTDHLRQLLPVEDALLVLTAGRNPSSYAVFALDPRDGKRRWNLELPETYGTELVRFGRLVIAARNNTQESHRLDLRKGSIAGNIPLPADAARFEAAAGPWLHYRTRQGKSLLVDPESAKTMWEGTLPSDTPTLQWVGGRWYSTGRKRLDWWSEPAKAN